MARKPNSQVTVSEKQLNTAIQDMVMAMQAKKAAIIVETEEDERNTGLIFDEAQFDMEGREYFEIEYLSGDMYKGELQGEKRHGFGMFTYK